MSAWITAPILITIAAGIWMMWAVRQDEEERRSFSFPIHTLLVWPSAVAVSAIAWLVWALLR